MDAVYLGCLALRSSLFEATMGPLGYFGHAIIGGTAGIVLFAYGFFYGNQKMKRAGLAVLLSIIVAGTLAEILKLSLEMPRPKLRASYGFPSGHASTAFGLAAALGVSFPNLSPLFYLLATLTAISRLYFRAHYVWDVIGGALIGSGVGIAITKRFIHPSKTENSPWTSYLGWSFTVAVGVAALLFFLALEKNIRIHRISDSDASQITSERILVNFGTPDARSLLRSGWSGDEKWMEGKLSVVWAEGLASELQAFFPHSGDYRFHLHLFPYMPKGPACQRVEVKVNAVFVGRLHLEQGWNWYEISVPKEVIQSGKNDIQFHFDYAQSPKSRGLADDARPLSVAFSALEAVRRTSLSPPLRRTP